MGAQHSVTRNVFAVVLCTHAHNLHVHTKAHAHRYVYSVERGYNIKMAALYYSETPETHLHNSQEPASGCPYQCRGAPTVLLVHLCPTL